MCSCFQSSIANKGSPVLINLLFVAKLKCIVGHLSKLAKREIKTTEIKDLVSGMKKVNIQAFILEKGTRRTVRVAMQVRDAEVCDFQIGQTKIASDGNTTMLVLWDSDIDKFRLGDQVNIENGFTTTFKGNLQLNVGKFGKISLVS